MGRVRKVPVDPQIAHSIPAGLPPSVRDFDMDQMDNAFDVTSQWNSFTGRDTSGIDRGHVTLGASRAAGNPEVDAPGVRRLRPGERVADGQTAVFPVLPPSRG